MSQRNNEHKLGKDLTGNERHKAGTDEFEDEFSGNDFLEEMGTDYAVGSRMFERDKVDIDGISYEEAAGVESRSGYGYAWVAFFFAAAAWFMWPVLLGITSAIIGIIAFMQGAKGLAGAAIAIGLGAALFNLFAAALY